MPALRYDITLEVGATFELDFEYQEEDGSPISLEGYTAAMHVRRKHGAAELLLALTTDAEITLDASAGSGHCEVAVPETIPPGAWVYDLELTSPDGKVIRLLEGHAKATANVTRTETTGNG